MKKGNLTLLTCISVLVLGLVLIGGTAVEAATKTKSKPAAKATSSTTNKTEQQPAQKQAAVTEMVEETFKKTFPRVPYDAIKPTEVKGLYEVNKGTELIYYFPDTGHIFIGDLISKEGKSVTAERKGELVLEKIKDIPLDKAIVVGNGKNTILEFTDPDCPYCRKASEGLAQLKDVKRYIFFFPLPMHPDAENKAKYIFCAEDRAKAYEDAMKGKFDDMKYEKCEKPEAVALLNLHKEIGTKVGVTGTPLFIVNGKKMITGANIPQIEAAFIK